MVTLVTLGTLVDILKDEIISFLDALFCLFAFEIIEPLGFDYCYNWKELKTPKTFQCRAELNPRHWE